MAKKKKKTDRNVAEQQSQQSCSTKLADTASSENFKNQNIEHETKKEREKVDER